MKPRFIYNYVCLYDLPNDVWKVYEILDKRIPKNVESYGSRVLGIGQTADDAIADANVKNKVAKWGVKVVKDE